MANGKCTKCNDDVVKSGYCKPCTNAFSTLHYLLNKDKYIKKANEQDKERRRWLNTLKNKPCMDCKKNYPPYVMDFDHLENKQFNISHMIRHRMGKEKIIVEMNKCDLICANCHRIRTYNRSKGKL